jgi:hypothetical protein
MKNLKYGQIMSTKHSLEVSGYPFLVGDAVNSGQAQSIRTYILWRANAYLAQRRRSGNTDDLQQAMAQLHSKTEVSWWMAAENKPIAAILSDMSHENHDRESGFLNC